MLNEIDIKNKVIITLVLLLAIFAYYNFKPNHSSEVSFEKKQECVVYKKQIEDKFEKNNNGEIPMEYYYFDKIFYSPKQDSCLYVYSGQFGLKATDRYRFLYLADALSNTVIIKSTVIADGEFMSDAQTDFYERVKSYEI